MTGSTFQFRVKYTDTNNDAPDFIRLLIDKNSNDSYDAGETIDLAAVDGSELNYFDGKIYSTSVVLTSSDGNDKKYQFEAASKGDVATGDPTGVGSVYVYGNSAGSGSAPVLSWTGEVNYTSDGVHPDTDVSGSSFEFSVKYSDADGDAPALIRLWIDQNHDGAYGADEKYGRRRQSAISLLCHRRHVQRDR